MKEKFVIFPVDDDSSDSDFVSGTQPAGGVEVAKVRKEKENTSTEMNGLFPAVGSSTTDVQDTYENTFMEQVAKISNKRVVKPPSRYIEEINLTETCFTSLTSGINEPSNLEEALNSENVLQWRNALDDEYNSLIKNDTLKLVQRPDNVNIVGCRWVFKIKRNSEGHIDRFKARLVAKGFTQTQGVDYGEVFSPVARMTTIRSLLALANIHNFEIHQMDVRTAFLNGTIDYDVFMEQPEGYVDVNHSEFVCKLNKSIYGLKQSARCWNNTLHSYLISSGYHRSSADSCVYVKKLNNGKFVIIVVFVDDLILVSNCAEMLIKEKGSFCQRFDMEDKGDIHDVLGLLVKRDRCNGILTISQPDFIRNVLLRFKMEQCKPVSTPLEPN